MSRLNPRLQKLEEKITANRNDYSNLSEEQLDTMLMKYWKETATEYGITPDTPQSELAKALNKIWQKYP